jgi:hypothetical protein
VRIVDISKLQPFTAINLSSDPGAIGGHVHVPSCAQIVLNFQQTDAKSAHIVLYGRYAGAFHGTVAEANAIYTAMFSTASWTTLAGFLAPTFAVTGITIRDVNPLDGSGAIVTSNLTTGPGTSASPAIPGEVSLVVTKRTAKQGRSFRGRMYFAGWATNALGAGDVAAAAAVTALQNWATNLVGSSMSASGYTHVLGLQARAAYVSPITGTPFPARDATSEAITALQVRDNHWDSQRRRGLR